MASFIHCSASDPMLEVSEFVFMLSLTILTLNCKGLLTGKHYTL